MLNITHYSVQFSHLVVSDSLQPHGLEHTRLPSPTPGVYSLMFIESVMPSNHLILCQLLLPPSIFPSIRDFQMSQIFTSGGESTGVSASASVLPMNIQDQFPLGWTGWISLLSKKTLKSLQHHSSKASKCGPLEKRMANPFSILPLRSP